MDVMSLILSKQYADTLSLGETGAAVLEAHKADTNVHTSAEEKAAIAQKFADLNAAILGKQDTLVSGTNIKTINGQTILGSGNIDIQGSVTVDSNLSNSSTNPVQNKVITTNLLNCQLDSDGSLVFWHGLPE